MRIGMDIRVLAGGETTGIQVYTRELLSRFFDIGADEHSFVLFYNARHKSPLPAAWRAHPRVEIIERSMPSVLFDGFSTVGLPRVDRLLGGIDVFFQPHFLRAGLSRRCPRVVVAHDLSFEHNPAWFSWRSRFWHRRVNPRARLRAADHSIAVSDTTALDLQRLYDIPAERISVIHSGVTVPPERAVVPLRLPSVYWLVLSSAHARKNIPGAIAAYGLFRQRWSRRGGQRVEMAGLETSVHSESLTEPPALVIAGEGVAHSGSIARARERTGFYDDIYVLGAVTEGEKGHLLRNAALLLFPSFFEGFGFPPLEAQACGVPVIAGDRGALPEVLGDTAVLVDPYDIAGMAEAMEEVWGDDDLRKLLAADGRQHAARYSWDTAARETLRVLEKVV